MNTTNPFLLTAVIMSTFVIFWFIKYPCAITQIMKLREGDIILGLTVWLYIIGAAVLSLLAILHANH